MMSLVSLRRVGRSLRQCMRQLAWEMWSEAEPSAMPARTWKELKLQKKLPPKVELRTPLGGEGGDLN